MLNPSTADAERDDPTIRRVMDFAQRAGYGGIAVLNLYALRTPSPAVLFEFEGDKIGDLCDRLLHGLRWKDVLVAWGANANARSRANDVVSILRSNNNRLYCLGTNKDGSPKHPLYVPSSQRLMDYTA